MLALLQAGTIADRTGASDFWLWLTWGGMTLATITFLYLALNSGGQGLHHYVTSAIITLWAAFSYLIMATGGGITEITTVATTEAGQDGGQRLFYYIRYIDWLVTTPLLLLGLCYVAFGGVLRRNLRLATIIIVADIGMILTGLIAGATAGGFRWFWYVVSCVFFAVVLYFIWFAPRSLSVEARQGTPEGGPGLFFSLAVMLTVLWILYPVVWLLGTEGISALSNGVEVFFYAVLDIAAKIAFGLLLIGGIRRSTGAGARA